MQVRVAHTDGTASALVALAAYAATERLAPGSATASIGNRTIASASFGSTAASQTFTLPASSLHGDAVHIRVTRAGSKRNRALHAALYLPVPCNAPGELSAFRVVRVLTSRSAGAASSTASPLATMDFTAPSPVEVAAVGFSTSACAPWWIIPWIGW